MTRTSLFITLFITGVIVNIMSNLIGLGYLHTPEQFADIMFGVLMAYVFHWYNNA